MTTTATTAAQAAVAELLNALGWLAATLLPGTGRPYRAPTLSPAQQAQRDREAKLERLERSGIAPGETPAPCQLDVADLLSEVMSTADELADLVCLATWRPTPQPVVSAFSNPTRFLNLVTRYLPLAATVDPALPGVVEARCDGLVYRAHAVLGLLGDGQLLDVVCPWCDGRAAGHPVGGAKTMRVRAQLPAGKRSVAGVDPKDVRWLVVCESGLCEPPEADCGERLRGRPAWPLASEGEWLAQRFEAIAG